MKILRAVILTTFILSTACLSLYIAPGLKQIHFLPESRHFDHLLMLFALICTGLFTFLFRPRKLKKTRGRNSKIKKKDLRFALLLRALVLILLLLAALPLSSRAAGLSGAITGGLILFLAYLLYRLSGITGRNDYTSIRFFNAAVILSFLYLLSGLVCLGFGGNLFDPQFLTLQGSLTLVSLIQRFSAGLAGCFLLISCLENHIAA